MQSREQNRPTMLRRALSGALLLAIGLILLAIAWGYPVGRLTDMGPGYIPRVVGFAICTLAVAIIAIDVTDRHFRHADTVHWRALIFVSVAITLFAVLIDIAGLIPSIFVAVVASMLADDRARPLSVLIYAVLASLACWLLFVVALELPIPAFWR